MRLITEDVFLHILCDVVPMHGPMNGFKWFQLSVFHLFAVSDFGLYFHICDEIFHLIAMLFACNLFVLIAKMSSRDAIHHPISVAFL